MCWINKTRPVILLTGQLRFFTDTKKTTAVKQIEQAITSYRDRLIHSDQINSPRPVGK